MRNWKPRKMRSWKEFRVLAEKRKNPELNRKDSVASALFPYLDDNTIAISFSDVKKIGVFPESDWFTPNGVYAYQLNDFKQEIRAMIKRAEGKPTPSGKKPRVVVAQVFPYASERDYIFVLKMKPNLKWLRMKGKVLSKNEYEKNLERFLDWIVSHKDATVRRELEQKAISDMRISQKKWNAYKEIDKFGLLKNNLRSLAARYATDKNGSQRLYLSMNRIIKRATYDQSNETKHTNMFNAALRHLGFDALRDDGTMTISRTEPYQVMFLHPKAYKVVDMIRNTDAKWVD